MKNKLDYYHTVNHPIIIERYVRNLFDEYEDYLKDLNKGLDIEALNKAFAKIEEYSFPQKMVMSDRVPRKAIEGEEVFVELNPDYTKLPEKPEKPKEKHIWDIYQDENGTYILERRK